MAISKRLRYEILRRDNHTCQSCGRKAPDVELAIDHVIPVALGGSDSPSNLRATCRDCNSGKSSIPPDAGLVDSVAAEAQRWSDAVKQASDELAAKDDLLDDICEAVAAAWSPRYMPSDFKPTVRSFALSGLSKQDMVDMAWVAITARHVDNRWAYFIGCCKRRLADLHDRAAEIAKEPKSRDELVMDAAEELEFIDG